MREYVLYVVLVFLPIGAIMAYLLQKEGVSRRNIALVVLISWLIIVSFPLSIAKMGTFISLMAYIVVILVMTRYLLGSRKEFTVAGKGILVTGSELEELLVNMERQGYDIEVIQSPEYSSLGDEAALSDLIPRPSGEIAAAELDKHGETGEEIEVAAGPETVDVELVETIMVQDLLSEADVSSLSRIEEDTQAKPTGAEEAPGLALENLGEELTWEATKTRADEFAAGTDGGMERPSEASAFPATEAETEEETERIFAIPELSEETTIVTTAANDEQQAAELTSVETPAEEPIDQAAVEVAEEEEKAVDSLSKPKDEELAVDMAEEKSELPEPDLLEAEPQTEAEYQDLAEEIVDALQEITETTSALPLEAGEPAEPEAIEISTAMDETTLAGAPGLDETIDKVAEFETETAIEADTPVETETTGFEAGAPAETEPAVIEEESEIAGDEVLEPESDLDSYIDKDNKAVTEENISDTLEELETEAAPDDSLESPDMQPDLPLPDLPAMEDVQLIVESLDEKEERIGESEVIASEPEEITDESEEAEPGEEYPEDETEVETFEAISTAEEPDENEDLQPAAAETEVIVEVTPEQRERLDLIEMDSDAAELAYAAPTTAITEDVVIKGAGEPGNAEDRSLEPEEPVILPETDTVVAEAEQESPEIPQEADDTARIEQTPVEAGETDRLIDEKPAAASSQLFVLIDQGFALKEAGRLQEAVECFMDADALTDDAELKELLNVEIVNIFRLLG